MTFALANVVRNNVMEIKVSVPEGQHYFLSGYAF